MNYGSQPISTKAVEKSLNTPLNLMLVDQDCKYVRHAIFFTVIRRITLSSLLS